MADAVEESPREICPFCESFFDTHEVIDGFWHCSKQVGDETISAMTEIPKNEPDLSATEVTDNAF